MEQGSGFDLAVISLYALTMVAMGVYYFRRSKTAEQFMVAGRRIPSWAAGLAVMSAYTSSISYIATPGKAYDSNWHPLIFALSILPVAWFVTRYIVPHYWKSQLVSVYNFLEDRLGLWARSYAAIAFLLYMIGRVAVILYLAGLLMSTFVPVSIATSIVLLGTVTIVYTLFGGMEAVIWTDVLQSAVMLIGVIYCAVFLTVEVFGPASNVPESTLTLNKFSLGSLTFTLSGRTIWVMLIYGISENLRNLMADQNYVQKYISVNNIRDVKKAIWTAMLIYIPLTALFLYMGTLLFAFYSGEVLPAHITKGDEVFPYYIATQIPAGLRGLIIAAILAAAMSTVDSALNCSSTVSLLDFFNRLRSSPLDERQSLFFLRTSTVFWGLLGTGFALLMLNAKSALDVWWQISGIFGGGILGLFIISLLRSNIPRAVGLTGIALSVISIAWGTFARGLPRELQWFECTLDPILVGVLGTGVLLLSVLGASGIHDRFRGMNAI